MALWERQEGESAPAYNAFWTYCTTPEDEKKSCGSVAQKLRKSYTLIRRWSKTWDWEPRARAYDNHLIEAELEAIKKERVKSARRHISIARSFQNKVIARLNKLDAGELSTADMVRWFDISVKIERQAMGEPSEVITQEITGRDGGPLEVRSGMDLSKYTEEELVSLAQLVTKGIVGAGDQNEKVPDAGRNQCPPARDQKRKVRSTKKTGA
jgi:hypothetical protein